jgi:Fe-S-cluster containining protein
MKRKCPYCGQRFKGKDLKQHLFEAHQGRGAKFFCREGCVRCCSDPGAPLELVLSDIERIATVLGLICEDFFKIFGGVLWSNIPGTPAVIPSTGLPFPCKFLKEGKCKIYEVRPLHCRLFPERLYIDSSPQKYESFYKAGYECVDEGLTLDEGRALELTGLIEKDQRELERTAEFFRNEDFIYELSPPEYNQAQLFFGQIEPDDPQRNMKRRSALEGLIPEKFKEEVRSAFISRLKGLDKESK